MLTVKGCSCLAGAARVPDPGAGCTSGRCSGVQRLLMQLGPRHQNWFQRCSARMGRQLYMSGLDAWDPVAAAHFQGLGPHGSSALRFPACLLCAGRRQAHLQGRAHLQERPPATGRSGHSGRSGSCPDPDLVLCPGRQQAQRQGGRDGARQACRCTEAGSQPVACSFLQPRLLLGLNCRALEAGLGLSHGGGGRLPGSPAAAAGASRSRMQQSDSTEAKEVWRSHRAPHTCRSRPAYADPETWTCAVRAAEQPACTQMGSTMERPAQTRTHRPNLKV